jgi:hypothetical protein
MKQATDDKIKYNDEPGTNDSKPNMYRLQQIMQVT